jgi:hypothetical protein
VSPPLPVARDASFTRANIEFDGVEQAGPAYEGRVFLNNPEAEANTPRTAECGYAGSFHVYGLGVPLPEKASIRKSVIATEAVRAALAKSESVTVTVVPIYVGSEPAAATRPIMFDDVRIVLE